MRRWGMGRDRKAAVRCSAVFTVAAIGLVAAAVGAAAIRSSVPAGLAGTWGKTVTSATWGKNGEYGEPGGHWRITITKAGETKMFAPAPIGFFTSMHVSTSGTSAVFGRTADRACPNNGSYTWKVSGSTLVLKVVKDGCNPRRILLTAGAWKRG